MTYYSITCAHCGSAFKAKYKRKYCADQCKHRAAYEKALAKAPRCPRCNGPWQKETGKKLYCNKCYAEAGTINTNHPATRSCVECGAEYKWRATPRCSPCNNARALKRAIEAGKVCEHCERPATHGEHCATCYRRIAAAKSEFKRHRDKERHRNDPVYDKTCGFCDNPFRTTDNRAIYCSRNCYSWDRSGRSKSKEIALRRSPERLTRSWVGHAIPPRKGNPLSAGRCTWCGDMFIGLNGAIYCTNKCANNAAWKRRYDARGEFKVSDRVRQGIYERDNWMCQLCGEPVPKGIGHNEKLSPTLDHIIPQSLQLIPDHSEKNLRLAHLICNAKRGNKMDDLALTA